MSRNGCTGSGAGETVGPRSQHPAGTGGLDRGGASRYPPQERFPGLLPQGVERVGIFHGDAVGILYTTAAPLILIVQMKYLP